jgi:drug/metabolite transporter (DMT)-like permease
MSDNTKATDASTQSTPTGLRRGALTGYRWLLLAFLVLGVVQIFLAGLGVFNLNGEKLGTPGETAFDPHRVLGYVMAVVAVIILVLAVIARAGGRAIILSALLILLAGPAQSILADLGEDTPFFGGLHALDGLVILGIAGFLHSSARRR